MNVERKVGWSGIYPAAMTAERQFSIEYRGAALICFVLCGKARMEGDSQTRRDKEEKQEENPEA